jgi:exonuclease III
LFETKATGARFLFFSTHLTTGDAGVRRAQWWEMITRINQLRNTYDVPVIAVGDFNTHKFSDLGDDMLRAMRNNGYGDVTGQEGWTNRLDHQRAGRMVNGWINSWNRLDRNVRHYSYYDDRDRAGNMIDWIFATNRLDVSEFKQTIDYGNDLQVDGVFPSDHNMIRATITLP